MTDGAPKVHIERFRVPSVSYSSHFRTVAHGAGLPVILFPSGDAAATMEETHRSFVGAEL